MSLKRKSTGPFTFPPGYELHFKKELMQKYIIKDES